MNPLPSKDQIRQWIAENPGLSSSAIIAKAFGLKGDAGRVETPSARDGRRGGAGKEGPPVPP
jgi:hypothetical protein